MAISTYRVYLMHKKADGDQWDKLVDIKSFPDLGGPPEMLETTTLSDYMQTYINGIQSAEGLEFECNYDMAVYQTLKALEGKKESYAVTPDGSNGKFSFDGELSVHPTGGGVNEVVNMNVTIAPSTPIQFSAT